MIDFINGETSLKKLFTLGAKVFRNFSFEMNEKKIFAIDTADSVRHLKKV